MTGKISFCLLLPLFLLSCSAYDTKGGFFTGQRASIVDILKEANAPTTSTDKAIALALKAKAQSQNSNDVYVDGFIDITLSRLYDKAGDKEAASAHQATGQASLFSTMERDGFAQSLYTTYLLSYDLGIPLESVPPSAALPLQEMVDSVFKEIEEAKEDADDPKEVVLLERTKGALTDMMQGLSNKDERKLRHARDQILALIAEMARRQDLDDEDRQALAIQRDVFSAVLDLQIASLQRDRRGYERAARAVAAQVNKIIEMNELE
ncbi:MAG: hypothetical protein ACJ76Y_18110 [Thermoanaerobaculia bacterium]